MAVAWQTIAFKIGCPPPIPVPRRVKWLGMFAVPPPPEKRSLDPTLASATRSVLSQADLTRDDYVEYCLHLVLRSQLPPPRTYTHTHTN